MTPEQEQMVADNMGLVWKAARGMKKNALLDYDDFVQAGSIGLMYAVQRYDESKGVEFSTIAVPYIRGYMMKEKSRNSHITVPVNVKDLANRIARNGMVDEAPEVIAEKFGARIGRVKKALYYLSLRTLSYNRKFTYNSEDTFEHLFGIMQDEEWAMVNEFISILKPTYQVIIRESMAGKSLSEIGREQGKSRQNMHSMRNLIKKKWLDYAEGRRKNDRRPG